MCRRNDTVNSTRCTLQVSFLNDIVRVSSFRRRFGRIEWNNEHSSRLRNVGYRFNTSGRVFRGILNNNRSVLENTSAMVFGSFVTLFLV